MLNVINKMILNIVIFLCFFMLFENTTAKPMTELERTAMEHDVALWTEEIKKGSTKVLPFKARGMLLFTLGRFEDAWKDLSFAVTKLPFDTEILIFAAEALMKKKDPANARKYANRSEKFCELSETIEADVRNLFAVVLELGNAEEKVMRRARDMVEYIDYFFPAVPQESMSTEPSQRQHLESGSPNADTESSRHQQVVQASSNVNTGRSQHQQLARSSSNVDTEPSKRQQLALSSPNVDIEPPQRQQHAENFSNVDTGPYQRQQLAQGFPIGETAPPQRQQHVRASPSGETGPYQHEQLAQGSLNEDTGSGHQDITDGNTQPYQPQQFSEHFYYLDTGPYRSQPLTQPFYHMDTGPTQHESTGSDSLNRMEKGLNGK